MIREKDNLKIRYAAIFSSMGMIFMLSGGLMMTPLLILLSNPEELSSAWAFCLPAGCLVLLGIVLRRFKPSSDITLSVQ